VPTSCGTPEKGCGRKIADLRQTIPTDSDFDDRLVPITFAPFDQRWVFYRKDVINVHSYAIARHLFRGNNLVLLAMRQVVLGKSFPHIFVTRSITNNRAFYSTRGKVYMFPLWIYDGEDELELTQGRGRLNLNERAVRALIGSAGQAGAGCTRPEEVVQMAYAVAHSSMYRHRYDASLRMDYPRFPTPSSSELRCKLIHLGGELVSLHLLETPTQQGGAARSDKVTRSSQLAVGDRHPPRVALSFCGPENPMVDRVGWSDDTVWLDAPKAKKGQVATPGHSGFRGVPEDVWNFEIGGYQVCEKWLKDRTGRTLSKDELEHYQKIVGALAETIRLMREIDEVIDAYGGWPGAFAPSTVTDHV
jgi:hypothetical protein